MIYVEPDVLKKIAKIESISETELKIRLKEGSVVVPKNINRKMKTPCAVGKGLKTKVNANIGLSPGYSSIAEEMKKMEIAVSSGADALMDLSTGPLLDKLRTKILAKCPVPVGTVPVYELACSKNKKFIDMNEEDFLNVLEKQGKEGVDFFTIHSGVTLESVRLIHKRTRIMNVVSRGGALITSWMIHNGKENPFFSRFNDVIKIAKKYNVTLSLGDSLRPGAISDATDHLQIQELLVLGEQQQMALKQGVQVMIEGPGHVPLDQIEANVKLQKSICHNAPFYVLGPLVTDCAPGYDHIVGAIGGAIAAWHGADFLCYVTPAEHLRLPDGEDVRQGVIASKIAAHAADIVKGVTGALQRDIDMSKARAKRDWKKQYSLALDPHLPKKVHESLKAKDENVCTMCSEYCSIKVMEDILDKK